MESNTIKLLQDKNGSSDNNFLISFPGILMKFTTPVLTYFLSVTSSELLSKTKTKITFYRVIWEYCDIFMSVDEMATNN